MATKNNAPAITEVPSTLPAVIETLAIQQAVGTSRRSQAALAESSTGGISPFDLKQLRVPNGPAWDVDGRGVLFLDAVILHYHAGRQYRPDRASTPYDESTPTPPQCVSYDGATGYGDPGGDCQQCPLAIFGEDCYPMAFCYLVLQGETTPRLLTIPRTSLRGMRKYFADVRLGQNPVAGVVTRLTPVKRDKGSGFQIGCEMVGILGDEAYDWVQAYIPPFRASIRYDRAVGGKAIEKPVDPTARPTNGGQKVHVCSTYCGEGTHYQAGTMQPVHVCNMYCTDMQHCNENATPVKVGRRLSVNELEVYQTPQETPRGQRSEAEKAVFGDDDDIQDPTLPKQA